VFFEYLHLAGHAADLAAVGDVGDFHIELVFGQGAHGFAQGFDAVDGGEINQHAHHDVEDNGGIYLQNKIVPERPGGGGAKLVTNVKIGFDPEAHAHQRQKNSGGLQPHRKALRKAFDPGHHISPPSHNDTIEM